MLQLQIVSVYKFRWHRDQSLGYWLLTFVFVSSVCSNRFRHACFTFFFACGFDEENPEDLFGGMIREEDAGKASVKYSRRYCGRQGRRRQATIGTALLTRLVSRRSPATILIRPVCSGRVGRGLYVLCISGKGARTGTWYIRWANFHASRS